MTRPAIKSFASAQAVAEPSLTAQIHRVRRISHRTGHYCGMSLSARRDEPGVGGNSSDNLDAEALPSQAGELAGTLIKPGCGAQLFKS